MLQKCPSGTKGITEEYTSPQVRKGLQENQGGSIVRFILGNCIHVLCNTILLGVVGIIAFSYFVVWYGCPGRMKEHTDWIFKGKKKIDDVNSGAKYG